MKQIQNLEFEKKFDDKGNTLIKINGKFILESRYIVEQFLKRKLKKEIIYHINGIKQDNELNNLMLFKNKYELSNFNKEIKKFGFTKSVIKNIENNIIQFELNQQSVFKS